MMKNADQSMTNDADATGGADAVDAPGTGSVNCLPIGTRLAEFEITSVIGEGGFGIVYLAFDHSLQRIVALKEYMPAALAARGTDHGVAVRSKRHDEAFAAGLRSFINEARLLAQFDHSALVKVYRFWEQNNTAYMAMRFYEGQTLKNVIKTNPGMIDEAWLKQILKPILEALDALYKVNILHRDISPENIMIQPNGEAVLLDFGAARQIVTGMTKSLTVILKPGYAPVEQYADDESMTQGPWTDIYSLSAVVYSAIAKKPPPTAVTRLLSDPIEPLQRGEYAGFDKAFLAAIDRGLAVRPEDRPQTIAEFAGLLGIDMSLPSHTEAVVRPFPPSPSGGKQGDATVRKPAAAGNAGTPPAPSMRKPAAKRTLLLAAGVVALVVAASGLWLSGGRVAARGPQIDVLKTAAPKEEIIPWESLARNRGASVSAAAAPVSQVAQIAQEGAARPADPTSPKTAASKKAKATPEASARHAADARAKPVEEGAAAPTGTVALNIKPWGNVFVDGEPKGVSPPLKKLTLPEGQHQIKIVNPNFPAYVANVAVHAKTPTTITRDFASSTP